MTTPDNDQRFRPYSDFLARHFDVKVQKLSVDAGMSCPNRDGTIGRGGCSYCNNRSFSPAYCAEAQGISEQLEAGKNFFARKYPAMKYLAYFQTHTNTYGSADDLMRLYEEALAVDDIVGIVIGTRPDCMPEELLNRLSDLARRTFVMMEYGVETSAEEALKRVGRGHTFAQAADTIRRTADAGIPVGAHLILGLPGTDAATIAADARRMSELPVDVLKLHQLQIVRGTRMAAEYARRPADFRLFTPEAYADAVVDFLECLRPTIAVERFTSQSPSELLIAPSWGLKNYQFVEMVRRRLRERDTWQGRLCGE